MNFCLIIQLGIGSQDFSLTLDRLQRLCSFHITLSPDVNESRTQTSSEMSWNRLLWVMSGNLTTILLLFPLSSKL